MIVRQLTLTDFRNYESLDLDLSPGANLFVGSNGQGKTNLVEALGYFSTLGSHRVSLEQSMIRSGQDSAIMRARLMHAEQEVLLEVQLNRSSANRAQVNRGAIRTRELPRYFSSVLFAPEDLALVRGEPGGRRRFMDELLVLRTPRMSGVIADYDRVLRQRNTLLKSARNASSANLSTLDIWDDRLIQFGSEIVSARTTLVKELAPEVNRAYSAIVGSDHSAHLANYLSIFSTNPEDEASDATPAGSAVVSVELAATAFRNSLARRRRAELDRGLTLVGPHRDDLALQLNALPARTTASHGESWSLALALKLASAAVLRRESSTGDPVLILDDVFAELDESRRARLADAIGDFEQVLITAAVPADVPQELATRVVRISAGRIVGNDE